MVRKLQWSVLCLLVLGCAAVAVWAGTKLRAGSEPMPLVRKAPEDVRKAIAEPASSVSIGGSKMSEAGRAADTMPPPSPPIAGEVPAPSSTPISGADVPPKPDFPTPGVDVATAPPPPSAPVSSEVPSLPKSPNADPLVSPPPSPPPPGIAGLPTPPPDSAFGVTIGLQPPPSAIRSVNALAPAPVPEPTAPSDGPFRDRSAALPSGAPLPSPPDSAPASPLITPTPSKPAPIASPWDLKVKIVDGRTMLEARNGDKVQLQIKCAHLTLQTPDGNLQAQGDVKVTSSDLDGSCEHLTIAWQNENIVLEGKVRLKCPREGQEIDLVAERLSVKLSGTKAVKAKAKPVDENSNRAKPSTSY